MCRTSMRHWPRSCGCCAPAGDTSARCRSASCTRWGTCARFEDGQLLYLKEPEYHGNPVDPANGALVFETPGWNLIARARAAGFGGAYMRFVASELRGYVSEQTGLFIFCAQK